MRLSGEIGAPSAFLGRQEGLGIDFPLELRAKGCPCRARVGAASRMDEVRADSASQFGVGLSGFAGHCPKVATALVLA